MLCFFLPSVCVTRLFYIHSLRRSTEAWQAGVAELLMQLLFYVSLFSDLFISRPEKQEQNYRPRLISEDALK